MNAIANAAAPVDADPAIFAELADEALLLRIAGDDKQAFRTLTLRHLDNVWRRAYRLLRNRQDAEDVMQEVFVIAWNHRHQWRTGEAKFSTWLYRVATNRSIDLQRKRKGETLELSEEIAESGDTPADDMVANLQLQEALLTALKTLPEKQMQALLYVYYEEMDIPEICTRLGATEDSVRSLLKRGKAGMREALAEQLQHDQQKIEEIARYLLG